MSSHAWEPLGPRLTRCRACGYRVRELADGSMVYLIGCDAALVVVDVFDAREELPECRPLTIGDLVLGLAMCGGSQFGSPPLSALYALADTQPKHCQYPTCYLHGKGPRGTNRDGGQ